MTTRSGVAPVRRPAATGRSGCGATTQAPALRIEAAEAPDCGAIARVHVRAWQLAYQRLLPADYLASLDVAERESMWRQALATGTPRVLVARGADHAVLGFVAWGPSREVEAPVDEGELWALYVDPQHWCKGAGRLLCRAAIDALHAAGHHTISLWVIDGNDRAQRFYAAMGFRPQPASRQPFMLGGAEVHEIRYVHDESADDVPPAPPAGWVQC